MQVSVEDFTTKLSELKKQGFIPTVRTGPTGVGHTLEQTLGLSENNLIVPDLGEVELKTTRRSANSLVTLFTLDRNAWIVPQSQIIKSNGIQSEKERDRINLYVMLSGAKSLRGMKLDWSDNDLWIKSDEEGAVAHWSFDSILTQFHRKIRHLILVTAESRSIDNVEHFYYNKATFYSGWLLRWHLPKLFSESTIAVDIRMHLRNNRVRNHGTGFRIRENHFDRLYPYGEKLPI